MIVTAGSKIYCCLSYTIFWSWVIEAVYPPKVIIVEKLRDAVEKELVLNSNVSNDSEVLMRD